MRFKTTLTKKEIVARDTILFHFQKPHNFSFTCGQSVDLIILDMPTLDTLGNSRTFSLASSPYEQEISFVMRLSNSVFKQTLWDMEIGSPVLIEGPFNGLDFSKINDKISGDINGKSAEQSKMLTKIPTKILIKTPTKPTIFLAGGVGIAPFRSYLRSLTDLSELNDSLSISVSRQIILFYSNRRLEDASFLQELQELEQLSKTRSEEQGKQNNFIFIPTMTAPAIIRNDILNPWQGECRRINQDFISGHIAHHLSSDLDYFVAGPTRMTNGMRTILAEMGVVEKHIQIEEFAGC